MICTNDKKIYETIRILRGHGLLRESGNKKFENKIKKKYNKLSPNFIFLYPGFNMRNNEIQAIIGINQLKRLDANNKLRAKNFQFFLSKLDKNKFFTDYLIKGNSNYAFPLILKTKSFRNRDRFEKHLTKNRVEFRRGNAGGGNQMRQPYLKKVIKVKNFNNFQNVERVHHFGYYIGNFPQLSKKNIIKLVNIINNY